MKKKDYPVRLRYVISRREGRSILFIAPLLSVHADNEIFARSPISVYVCMYVCTFALYRGIVFIRYRDGT